MINLGEGWSRLCDLPTEHERMSAHQAAIAALSEIHAASAGTRTSCGVHGDLRSNNIMVYKAGSTFQIQFIDFDWAGQESACR